MEGVLGKAVIHEAKRMKMESWLLLDRGCQYSRNCSNARAVVEVGVWMIKDCDR